MNIGITIKKEKDLVYVVLGGEIDAYTAPKLKEELLPFTQMNKANLIVNLEDVTYMDSTGLGVFIGLLKNIRQNNGTLKLVGLSERLERLFSITGLTEIMDITSKVEGGVQ